MYNDVLIILVHLVKYLCNTLLVWLRCINYHKNVASLIHFLKKKPFESPDLLTLSECDFAVFRHLCIYRCTYSSVLSNCDCAQFSDFCVYIVPSCPIVSKITTVAVANITCAVHLVNLNIHLLFCQFES